MSRRNPNRLGVGAEGPWENRHAVVQTRHPNLTAVGGWKTKAKPKAKKKTPVRYCKERKRDGSPCKNAAMRDRDICSSHARKAHRPSIIDAALRERFMQGLATGVGIETAAAYAGIAPRTAYLWLERGEKEDAAGTTPDASEFVAFLQGVSRTRATVQVTYAAEARRAIRENQGGTARAALMALERLAPADWSAHRVVEHTHEGTVSMELLDGRQPVDVPLETREKIAALLEAAVPIDATAEEVM